MDSKEKLSLQKGIISLLVPIIIIVIVAVGGFVYWTTTQKPTQITKQTNTITPQSGDSMMHKSSFEIVGQPKLIFTGGYADPTLSTLPDGKYIMYVNNFSKQPATYEAHTSSDGVTWTKATTSLPNASTGRIVKFGSTFRLYYPDQTPIRPTDPPASILSATSSDGLIFTKESGTRVDPRNGYYLEGPTVLTLPNGSYRMLFSENETTSAEKRISQIWGASSKDGISWTRDSKVTLEADGKVEKMPAGWPQALHPFVLTRKDGSYLMLYNSHSEVYAAESTDGLTWTKLGDVGVHGADVDGFYQSDGSIRLYYGDFSPETLGVVYTVVIKENK